MPSEQSAFLPKLKLLYFPILKGSHYPALHLAREGGMFGRRCKNVQLHRECHEKFARPPFDIRNTFGCYAVEKRALSHAQRVFHHKPMGSVSVLHRQK